jgi:hypothetical protein
MLICFRKIFVLAVFKIHSCYFHQMKVEMCRSGHIKSVHEQKNITIFHDRFHNLIFKQVKFGNCWSRVFA